MSRRLPNQEQKVAIEHQGGVLLRAGAGSGKTFVLVEHIVYLTKSWIAEYQKQKTESFEDFLRRKYSQVVMMTFTKKAAGEMSIRLTEMFADLSREEGNEEACWKTAYECLPVLMVTTIDGFCRKLITNGYFPHLSTEADIIFETERSDQVRDLLALWFEKKSASVPSEILDIVIREKESLLTAFTSIFNDPGLRLAWKKYSLAETSPTKLGDLLTKSFELNDIQHALLAIGNLDLPEEKERSAFERFVAEVQSTGLPAVDSVEKLLSYQKLFEGKRLMGESKADKKGLPTHINAHQGLKNLRDWSKTWSSVVQSYVTHYEGKILPWLKLCQELYAWVEERLDPALGMTFGDIAYHVSLGLENRADRERIQRDYRYFIVDEFQDTSALQFKIIQSLIDGDYRRLFCVGDAKQAIYGFRGGELSVFQDCGELVPQVLSLANNYRSLPEVIRFNNSLFRTILPLGQGFEGVDPFSVEPEDQNLPAEVSYKEQGSIVMLKAALDRDLETEDKFKNEDINRLEAYLVAEAVARDRKTNPQDVCTILYSKLKPSHELIKQLMGKKVGFTAQFKIDLLDDPVTGMFLCLLRRQYDGDPDTKDRYPLFLLQSYLRVLGQPASVTAQDLEDFDKNVLYWGLLEAFRKFLHGLNLTNENSDINLEMIETLSEVYHQDAESIMVQIKEGSNERVSLDLRSGEMSHMVQIMSAHASKGLEFDHVYLAGIYTNGREKADSGLFGEMPGSFNWYEDLSIREKQPSPFYVFENELGRYKSFSEAKRLFYVACTRAKKKLSWVNFDIPEKAFSIPKNSWIDGLTAWLNHPGSAGRLKSLVVNDVTESVPKNLLSSGSKPQLPLFFHDPVGIFSKGEGKVELGLLAELSVTRLNSLVDCPRKFYFENILKLKGSKQTYVRKEMDDQSEELATIVSSSAERGTQIHALIAKAIERNFVVPREASGTALEKPIKWALDGLQALSRDYDFIAEKPLKFHFFDFMVSGIPDLVLRPKEKNEKLQIWDFKTGRITQESLNHYWVQLKAYAYAFYVSGVVPKTDSIETKLCFVDEEKFLTLEIGWKQIQSELFQIWRKQNEPWTIKTDHCSQCSYGDICPR